MEVRRFGTAIAVLLAVPWPFHATAVGAQTMRTARGVQQRPYIPPPRQPYNSMARDTTPFNCEQYRGR